jgi:hypothetical protein
MVDHRPSRRCPQRSAVAAPVVDGDVVTADAAEDVTKRGRPVRRPVHQDERWVSFGSVVSNVEATGLRNFGVVRA